MKNIKTMLFKTMIPSIFLLFQCTVSVKLIRVIDLSQQLIPYNVAWEWQEHLVADQLRLRDDSENKHVGSLLLVQHTPTYTLGSATTEESGPFSTVADDGSDLIYETIKVDRGGQATYHGPGQLVLYPILDLEYFDKDIHIYLRAIETITINALKGLKIETSTKSGLTGVWKDDYKIAAIGIKIKRWITMHGLSINISPDMRYFSNIIPCGIKDKSVGYVNQFEKDLNIDDVNNHVLTCFLNHFQVTVDEFYKNNNALVFLNELSMDDVTQ